jgi:hypothetical protein
MTESATNEAVGEVVKETFCAECGSVPCSCHLCSNCGELFCRSESCHLEAEHFDSADRAYDLAVDA